MVNWLSTRKIFQNENGDPTATSRDQTASVICARFSVQPSRPPFDKKHPNQISFFSVRNQCSNNSVQKVLSERHDKRKGE
jgi:hypothetical protein